MLHGISGSVEFFRDRRPAHRAHQPENRPIEPIFPTGLKMITSMQSVRLPKTEFLNCRTQKILILAAQFLA
jgi:hypothetical protein